ncbi:PH domain-containing protein [Pseudonocardia sp. TRM90224]|uniref:PH domain-containing protein n=1 Tax=Pseudonocardia sp. TRM90224 TaxID=2812678 RepID=UPI001E30AC20|nr:PH domain-containing protein [Pseudonocardia sp. TRM90224]
MGILDGIIGNSARIDPQTAFHQYAQLLLRGEEVRAAYQIGRDALLFTDSRLILVERQGIAGTRIEYRSLPYRSITSFGVEAASPFDLDAELRIWVAGTTAPIKKQFGRSVDVYEVQAVLGGFVAR